jgi:hypothetical protein
MFESFKGHPEDRTIDVSTLYFFFNQQRLLVSEPEFCFFVYQRFKALKEITLPEYRQAFVDFREKPPTTLEEIRIFFSSIDFQNKGHVTKEDFLQLLRLSETFKADQALVQENAERAFDLVCRAFRETSLSLEICYYLIKDLGEQQ